MMDHTEYKDPTEFPTGILEDIWREDFEERYELVEESEWRDQGKFSEMTIIFKDTKTGKHYSFEIWRSGSYFSHYEYEIWDKAVEVELREETITIKKWVTV